MRKKEAGTEWRKLSSGQEQWYRMFGLVLGKRNGKFLVLTLPKPKEERKQMSIVFKNAVPKRK